MVFAPFVVILLVVVGVVPQVRTNSCPYKNYFEFYENGKRTFVCLRVIELETDEDKKKVSEGYNFGDLYCMNEFVETQDQWSQPKLSTEFTVNDDEYIWIGLNREDSNGSWSDPTKWHWTKDKSTLADTIGNDTFWDENQPDKHGNDSNQKEYCVVARLVKIGEHYDLRMHDRSCDAEWQFSSGQTGVVTKVVCESPDTSVSEETTETNGEGSSPETETMGEVSTGTNGKVSESEGTIHQVDHTQSASPSDDNARFYHQWWFYLICVALVVVPSVATAVVCLIQRKRRRERPRSKSRRSSIGPRLGKTAKKKMVPRKKVPPAAKSTDQDKFRRHKALLNFTAKHRPGIKSKSAIPVTTSSGMKSQQSRLSEMTKSDDTHIYSNQRAG